MLEKPWILTPVVLDESLDADDLPHYGNSRRADAILRWKTLCDHLMAEADLVGRNKRGERPVTGNYLESLASLPMPFADEELAEMGKPSFGVIDVVIVEGTGEKDGPNTTYLTKPTRARNPEVSQSDNLESDRPASNVVASSTEPNATKSASATPVPLSPKRQDMWRSMETHTNHLAVIVPRYHLHLTQEALQKSDNADPSNEPEVPTKALQPIPALDGTNDSPSDPTNRELGRLWPPDRGSRKVPKRSRTPSLSVASQSSNPSRPSRKRRLQFHHVYDDKRTSSEEFQAWAERAFEDVRCTRARTSTFDASTQASAVGCAVDSSPLSSVCSIEGEVALPKESAKQSQIVTLRMSPGKLKSASPEKAGGSSSKIDVSRDEAPMVGRLRRSSTFNTASTSALTDPLAQTPEAQSATIPHKTAAMAPSRRSRRSNTSDANLPQSPHPTSPPPTRPEASPASPPNTPHTRKSQTPAEVSGFEVPELSRDCCITYAGPGVLRNVGAVRGGWFEEKRVMMGTRFIVG